MTNPFSGIITSDLKTLYTNMIDSLLEDDALTVPCRLIYEGTKWTLCPNCILSPMTGRSANVYNGSGPISFTVGVCPVCKGDGKLADQQTEEIYMCVLWNYKDWVGDWPVNSPDGHVQTISKLTTLDNIKRTNEIIINTDIEAYAKYNFVRVGEPNVIGFGASSYVFTIWKKQNG